jgi:DNA-binding beta-propeller fold protein YncE/mono/diheme cytochrome c family protein
MWVAESAAQRIAECDAASGAIIRRVSVSGPPLALTIGRDGRLFVAVAEPRGRIAVIRDGAVAAEFPCGHTPSALALTPDGNRLVVAERFDGQVAVLDARDGRVLSRQPAIREPVALALTPDGATAVVVNLLPVGRADGDDLGCSVSLIDVNAAQPPRTIRLPNGSTGAQGVALSPDGAFAYVTHLVARYQQPATQLERGWMNTNAVSVIDLSHAALVATVLLDDPESGAANPWAVAVSPDGAWLVVTHTGSQEISLIDRPALHRRLAEPGVAARAVDDLRLIASLRRRLPAEVEGPRTLLVTNGQIWVAGYFSDDLAVRPLPASRAEAPAPSRRIALGPANPVRDPVRLGEAAFNDARQCFQTWQSCASCHPGEARVDAVNWDLLNDGLGNPKNTKSLLNATRTPPSMWLGVRANATVAIRAGFTHVQYLTVDDRTAGVVEAYLASLAPVPSPRLETDANGQRRLSARAERGQAVFTAADCARCHRPPLYTDQRQHDVGLGTGPDVGKSFDTPSLIEAWRTAPYLHDGRAATIRDVLTDPAHPHGRAATLSPDDLDALILFVESL